MPTHFDQMHPSAYASAYACMHGCVTNEQDIRVVTEHWLLKSASWGPDAPDLWCRASTAKQSGMPHARLQRSVVAAVAVGGPCLGCQERAGCCAAEMRDGPCTAACGGVPARAGGVSCLPLQAMAAVMQVYLHSTTLPARPGGCPALAVSAACCVSQRDPCDVAHARHSIACDRRVRSAVCHLDRLTRPGRHARTTLGASLAKVPTVLTESRCSRFRQVAAGSRAGALTAACVAPCS